MNHIQYQSGFIPSISALNELYSDAGWTNYTKRLTVLKKAMDGSRIVITAWDGNRLVGLLRGVGDGYTILYIQDILVLKAYQRQGIGKTMLEMVFSLNKKVRQKVLLADQSLALKGFYEACGLQSQDAYHTVAYVKIEQ